PRIRVAQVAHAIRPIAPNWRSRPRVEVHAGRSHAIEKARVPERPPDVVEHQEGLFALPRAREPTWQTEQPLLCCMSIGVLHEHRQQLQRVSLLARRASLIFVDQVQLLPSPSGRFLALPHFVTGWLALDDRWIEFMLFACMRAATPGIRR